MQRAIVIVTDHPAFGRLLRVLLESEGYTAGVTAPGPDTVDRVRAEQPHLLLLDLRRPDPATVEVAGALYAAFPELPVVLLADPGRQRELRRRFQRAEWAEGGDVAAVLAAVRRALGEDGQRAAKS